MSTVALLDVSVLVALFDPDPVHHEVAHDWFAQEGKAGWATCPVTESGFVRVFSSPDSVQGGQGRNRIVCRGHRAAEPEAVFENVWRTLILLELSPLERLNRSLQRGRAVPPQR